MTARMSSGIDEGAPRLADADTRPALHWMRALKSSQLTSPSRSLESSGDAHPTPLHFTDPGSTPAILDAAVSSTHRARALSYRAHVPLPAACNASSITGRNASPRCAGAGTMNPPGTASTGNWVIGLSLIHI